MDQLLKVDGRRLLNDLFIKSILSISIFLQVSEYGWI